jgi:hypothetical protein
MPSLMMNEINDLFIFGLVSSASVPAMVLAIQHIFLVTLLF